MPRVLIKNAAIISMDPQIGDLASGDIVIEDGQIAEVGRGIEVADAEIIDASTMIVMPGFVDAHLHCWQTGIRGIAGNWSIADYVHNMHAILATLYTAEDTYLANLVGAMNQINAGVTTVLDWCHNNHTPAHSDGAIDGLEESGIRALFCHGSPKPDPEDGAPPFFEIPHPRAEIERLRIGRLASDDALVTLGMAILGPDFSTYEVTTHDINLAREFGLIVSAHIWGAPTSMNPDGIERMAKDGLLGPELNVVHGNYLTDRQLRILTDAGASFTVTPEVELYMSGSPPLTGRLRALGAPLSIGVDIESGVGGDMFTVTRMALQSQRMLDNMAAATAGEKLTSVSIEPREALAWATINGAKALGMDDRIGSLTPGKQADLIMIRADDINLFPVHDPVQAVVFHANGANVDTVLVAGKALKKNGALIHQGLAEKMERLRKSGQRLLMDAEFMGAAA